MALIIVQMAQMKPLGNLKYRKNIILNRHTFMHRLLLNLLLILYCTSIIGIAPIADVRKASFNAQITAVCFLHPNVMTLMIVVILGNVIIFIKMV